MKALLLIGSVLVFANFAQAENEGDTHCPQYRCTAISSNGAGGYSESYTDAQSRTEALDQCESNGGTRCRIQSCTFHKLNNVWGACLEPGGIFNPPQTRD